MYLKVHESGRQRIVAVCDEELVGKVLAEGAACLDLDRYRNFYVGVKAGVKEVRAALESFTSANLVGRKAVDVALAAGLARPDGVMYINGIPYIQIYRI